MGDGEERMEAGSGTDPDNSAAKALFTLARAATDTEPALGSGNTGEGKSELLALVQQHYGAGMDRTHLPANWSSTGNQPEGLAFLVKDAVLGVAQPRLVLREADVEPASTVDALLAGWRVAGGVPPPLPDDPDRRVAAVNETKPLVGQRSTKIHDLRKGFTCCSTVPRCRCHVRP